MYPNEPGSKGGGASKDAAEKIAATGRVAMLRDAITSLMANGYRLTADEIAKQLGENVLAVRPRVSELVIRKVLVKTEQRRKNASGMPAHVLRHAASEVAVELPAPEPAKPTRSSAKAIQSAGRGSRPAPAVHHDQSLFF
ncbi:hypothetical protein [Rhodopseudomonas palustris]|uniref:hypothetical protein n=1 Tax=Rhodopseudomonas palustris TaxID=1076 RepID=UPI000641B44B|nr:hypothetical protein [Rhodopseudomonas palustris]